MPAPDAALALRVALAQSGDRAALDRLLRDHQHALYRHARTIVRDEDLALDVLQASLLLIARRLATLREPRWFRAWAYRITTREAVRAARRRGRETLLFDDAIPVEGLDTPMPDDAAELAELCTSAIDRLPTGSRIVVRLHYQDGLTLAEIAEALELPLGTVKSRLAYGLARVRDYVAHAA